MPSNNMTTTKTGMPGTSRDLGETLSNVTSQVKDKASELGRMAADKIDGNRDAAAGGLETAALKIHGSADSLPGGRTVTGVAHKTADTLNSTADYIRRHDMDSMIQDLQRVVKNNPGPALLGAAVLGFLVGRSFSND